jgi:hypothetical protein
MAYEQQTTPPPGGQVVNAVKFVADQVFMPGTSLLVEGKVGAGLMHGVAGIAGRVLMGPVGWMMVGLNSYSKAASGKHLWEHFTSPTSEPEVILQEPPPQRP